MKSCSQKSPLMKSTPPPNLLFSFIVVTTVIACANMQGAQWDVGDIFVAVWIALFDHLRE